MAFKFVSLIASVLLIQSTTAQIIANAGVPCNSLSNSFNYGNIGLSSGSLNSYSNGLSSGSLSSYNGNSNMANLNNNLANSLNNGGGFIVTSTSPIAPSGISVLAENLLIEGALNVAGGLPLLATVALEGSLPTTGQASTTYSCGNGNVCITSQLGANGNSAGYGANGNSAGYGANMGASSGASNYGAINYGANLGGNCAGNRAY